MTRITGIRRHLSKALGFVIPPVKVSDDLSLPGNVSRISVAGVIVGEDEVFPNELLALDSGDLVRPVTGRPCKDPPFALVGRLEEGRGGDGCVGTCWFGGGR